MKYPFIENQNIEYNVLHALERDNPQAHYIHKFLRRNGVLYSIKQIYGAMQRLRRDGIIIRNHGLWIFVNN